jgi:parvulin-like peptidyl-prolyl isomerase
MVLALGVMAAACGSDEGDESLVARVGEYTLSVDDAVDLLVDEERLAADVGVVESLAELWVDYTLLAEATARDSTYVELDLEPIVLQQIQQVMVFQLRDSVIQVDTFVTDEELQALYEAESPELALRARHIMLQLPLGASDAQRDSVSTRLEAVRARISAGESFESLARQFSQDPGTAANGGDLGFFGRGDMVAPFEAAVLALQPGEVSEVVQTPMGLHLIRLDERRIRGFAEAAPAFRRQVQGRMVQEAESVFVAALYDRAQPEIVEGAADIVREMASNPSTELSGRAGRRALVSWEGAAVTVGDVRTVLQLESPALRTQLTTGTDEAIDDFLQSLSRRDLLVRAAESEGLRPPRDSIDVLLDDARTQLRGAARMLGLLDLDRAPGEDLEIAVARAVQEALRGNLTGATQVVPLGLVGFQLREGRAIEVRSEGVGQVIVDIAQIRAARSLSPVEETLGGSVTPDSTGR